MFTEVSALKRKRFESLLRTIRSKCVVMLNQEPSPALEGLLALTGPEDTASCLRDSERKETRIMSQQDFQFTHSQLSKEMAPPDSQFFQRRVNLGDVLNHTDSDLASNAHRDPSRPNSSRKVFDEDGSLLKSLEERLSSPHESRKDEHSAVVLAEYQDSHSPEQHAKANNKNGQTPQF